MQFLVVARDGTDDGASARRMAVREAHIEGAKAMAASGTMICGGALRRRRPERLVHGWAHTARRKGVTSMVRQTSPVM